MAAGTPVSLEKSWYAATAQGRIEDPTLAGDITCDVVIIGAGYTGLSAALELAGRGYDVVVLEAREAGWGASGRNGGQVARGFNKGVGELSKMVGRDDARHLWRLAEEARHLLFDRVTDHRIDCDLRRGHLTAALKPSHLAELDEAKAELDEMGVDGATRLDRDGIADAIQTKRYLGGLYDPGGAHIHPLNYALGLAAAARRAGARIFANSPVRRFSPGATRTALVEAATGTGTVRARHAILAGNAYLPDLGAEVARSMRPRVMPVGTFILATEPLGENRARALIPSGSSVDDMNFVLNYYRVSSDHRMLFGGRVAYNPSGREPRAQARLTGTMLSFFPQLKDARVDYFWGGDVAITVNRLPHLGRIAPNVFFAQGYSGHGVALSGLAGKVMAEAVAGTAERFDLMTRIPHRDFPGGRRMRTPILLLATTWFRLRDALGR